MYTKCLYCNENINKYTLYGLLIEHDQLCLSCRSKMKYHHIKFKLDDLEVESFYEYDSLFKDILLQYKECYDEALKDIFLYKIIDYLKLKYADYEILYVPSSKTKIEERGFNHLKNIFEQLGLNEVKGLKMIEDISQFGKNYIERCAMLKNYVYEGQKLNKVLIVDDVFTSGSSLKGVYDVIKKNCRQCKAIVLAKT